MLFGSTELSLTLKLCIMKNLFLTLVSLALFGTVSAHTVSSHNNSDNSFVFNEQGIEFAIFKDGQFDFNVLGYRQANARFSNRNGINISFNSGYDYAAFIQYDSYGAVIQIENTPIYYDYYGRISQAGNVHVNYDYRGRISSIGGMRISYDHYNIVRRNGYVNRQHRYYTPSVWHSYYRVPNLRLCVLFNKPYRKHYSPVRHRFENPYRNNRRPNVYRNQSTQNRIANRRSNHRDRYRTNRDSRRSVTNTTRSTNRNSARTPSSRTTNRSNNRERNNITNTNTRLRNNTSNSIRQTESTLRNSRVVAQRTPRTISNNSPKRRRR
tara:strand:- start:5374 stop:6345 length:972 start_codon:yes stop_codon:yes gene_type:complete